MTCAQVGDPGGAVAEDGGLCCLTKARALDIAHEEFPRTPVRPRRRQRSFPRLQLRVFSLQRGIFSLQVFKRRRGILAAASRPRQHLLELVEKRHG